MFQLWPVGALSVSSYVPSTYPHQCALVWKHILTFWHCNMLQAYLDYFISQSKNQHFIQVEDISLLA